MQQPSSESEQLRVGGELGFHSYSQAEVRAFTSFINELLSHDSVLAGELGRIPIDAESPDGLFRAIQDGVVLCQLVGAIKADLIRPSIVCLRPKNQFEALGNLQAVLFACRQLNISTVNVGAEDVLSGQKPHLVLGLIWQLIRCHLTANINVAATPALSQLMEAGETLDYFARLPAEASLLRWVNYHLARAGCPRRIANFAADIADAEAYDILLNQLAPTLCPRTSGAASPLERADAVLRNADKLGCRRFVTPADVVAGNAKLNMAFVAGLFHRHPGIAPPSSEEERARQLLVENQVRERLAREEALFRRNLQIERAQFEQNLADEKARIEHDLRRAWSTEEQAKRQFLEQSAASLDAERRKIEAERQQLETERQAFEQRRLSTMSSSSSPALAPVPAQSSAQPFQPPALQMGISFDGAPQPPASHQLVEFADQSRADPSAHGSFYASQQQHSGSFYGATQQQSGSFYGEAPPSTPPPLQHQQSGSFYGAPPGAGSFYGAPPGAGSFHGAPPVMPPGAGSFHGAPPVMPPGAGSFHGGVPLAMAPGAGSYYGAMPGSFYGGGGSFYGGGSFMSPLPGSMYMPAAAPPVYAAMPTGLATVTTTTVSGPPPVLHFPLARVRVTIEEAHDVAKKDLFGLGKSDPYCILAFKSERYTTRKCINTTHPVWYEDVVLQDVNPGDELVIAMWDCDRFKKDDFLGEVRVFGKDFIFGQSQVFKLMPRRGHHDRIHGDLRLKFQLI